MKKYLIILPLVENKHQMACVDEKMPKMLPVNQKLPKHEIEKHVNGTCGDNCHVKIQRCDYKSCNTAITCSDWKHGHLDFCSRPHFRCTICGEALIKKSTSSLSYHTHHECFNTYCSKTIGECEEHICRHCCVQNSGDYDYCVYCKCYKSEDCEYYKFTCPTHICKMCDIVNHKNCCRHYNHGQYTTKIIKDSMTEKIIFETENLLSTYICDGCNKNEAINRTSTGYYYCIECTDSFAKDCSITKIILELKIMDEYYTPYVIIGLYGCPYVRMILRCRFLAQDNTTAITRIEFNDKTLEWLCKHAPYWIISRIIYMIYSG
jgi:hypothetical protein